MSETIDNFGKHHELIKSRLHPALTAMSVQRSEALRNARLERADWMLSRRSSLSGANNAAWNAQNNVDKMLSSLQDAYSFAEPLLRKQLQVQYNVSVDLRNNYLALYKKLGYPNAYSSRKVSLLDAALHNFAHNETFDESSGFLVRIDATRDLYATSPLSTLISVEQFQALCRELDIGARYQAHLSNALLTKEPVAATFLSNQVQRNQKAALRAAASLALAKKDIRRDTYGLIQQALADNASLTLGDRPTRVCELSMLNAPLTGILLFMPLEDEPHSRRTVAYVPHDPEHPLKEYADPGAFLDELIRQLWENRRLASTGRSYRQFFSQFIDHSRRGHFFAELQACLTGYESVPGDVPGTRPTWRTILAKHPHLRAQETTIARPLWRHLYQRHLDKIINDARTVAVSTADADSNARWAFWDNIKKITLDILNVATMVIAPFIPGLGELMMAYTAYQMTDEVFEGVVDLAEGVWREAAEHLIGVISESVQFAALSVGMPILNEFKSRLSPWVESMTPVRLPNGEQRLWLADMVPYEHRDVRLDPAHKPDAQGIHHHQGQQFIRLEGRLLRVEKEPASDAYRLEHPSRPSAYRPRLEHNGQGAWRHEGEDPLTWDSTRLMRRIGHRTDGINASQLEAVRRISATDVPALQRMHLENAPPPLLLDDTLKRYKAFEEVGEVKQQISRGAPLDPSAQWFEQLVTELPGWPADCALKVYQHPSLSGGARIYGRADALAQRTLSISLGDVMAGKLPEAVTGFLDEAQLERLLGSRLPESRRVQRLRDLLAAQVDPRAERIAEYTYRFADRSRHLDVQSLQRRYPDLPTAIAERLLANAPPSVLESLAEQAQMPLALRAQARECAFEVSTMRAYEGFFKGGPMKVDTERLALNTLRLHSDTFADLHVEIREGGSDALRCAAGPGQARHRRLLLTDETGAYAVLDASRSPLFTADSLYEALLRAMPDDVRAALGMAPDEGSALRQWLADRAEAPSERRTALLRPSIRPVAELETNLLLRGPVLSRSPQTLEQHVQNLYPRLSEAEQETFIRSLAGVADPVRAVRTLQSELQTLENVLEHWKQKSATPQSDPDLPRIPSRQAIKISEDLMKCFRRESTAFNERSVRFDDGYTLDLSSEMLGFDLEKWWKTLPDLSGYLDRVTTLNLDNMRFSERPDGLLKHFTGLRRLSARNSDLTHVPEGVFSMRRLESLRLNANGIRLNDKAVERLGSLTRLQALRLDRNPLDLAPDVTGMRHLKVLSLSATSISQWPRGLLRDNRPRGFFLDLSQTPIRTVPSVEPGSPDGWMVARARLSADRLSDDQRALLFKYREAAGLPQTNAYAPLARDARNKWPLMSDSVLWGADTYALRAYREEAWDNLMNEPNSEGFFRIIDSLTQSADFRAGGETRTRLSQRVWDLIDAMDLDTPLREQLFETARNPTTCADASAEVFNTMGVQALASQAYAYSTSPQELERRLVTLGRGAARLARVNEVARADALSRPSRAEEVEIYLAYQTGLARRLDLPWQSGGMLHGEIAGVSAAAIDRACETVLSMEQGDGLVNAMLDLPFWEHYLDATYNDQLALEDRTYERQLEMLERRRLDDPMTEQEYSARISDLGHMRLEGRRRLTRLLLERHAAPDTAPSPSR